MSRKIKKSVSILLALVMLCGVLAVAPVTVGAEEYPIYTTRDGRGEYTLKPDESDPDLLEFHLVSGVFENFNFYAELDKTFGGSDVYSRINSITSDKVIFKGSCRNMFMYWNCERIDLSNVNTDDVNDMGQMFRECGRLKSIDISNFHTSNVTDMVNMFLGDTNLSSLDLSSFDMSLVRSTYGMFCNCNNLKEVEFSNDIVTSNVEDMRMMFFNCPSLTSLDLSGFDMSKAQNQSGNMFSGCSNLKELTISNKFTGGIKSGMSLNNGKSTQKGWITSDSTDGEIVSGGTTSGTAVIAAPYLPGQGETKTYVWYAGVYEFIEETGELHLISGLFNSNSWQYWDGPGNNRYWTANQVEVDDPEYIASADKVKSITAEPGVKFTGDCQNMFRGFSNCETIDLSNVDTSNVTSMMNMFRSCSELTSIRFSERFNTEKVEDMQWMFYSCRKLTSLDLSSFKINDVNSGDSFTTITGAMLGDCPALKKLTISDKFTGGIIIGMKLNNGENNNGWRISPSDDAERVSGNGAFAVIEQPAAETTYKWIEYATVTWKNWDNNTLDTEDYKLETIIHPTYKGTNTPTRPNSDGKTYTFVGWTDGETEYGLNDALPYVTQDITYTARYTVQTIKTYTLNYIYQGRSGGNKGAYVGDDGAADIKTYTVTVELGDSDLEESGMPKAKVLVDNAPVVNDPYKNCRWTFTDEYVAFDSENKVVTITAEQPERLYRVELKNSDNSLIYTTRVKLNSFVQKNDSFITVPETDGSGQPFAYWSVVQNGKETARCFEKRFNLRVTGDSVVTAHYGEAENLVTLSDAEISRQKFTENGTTKDLLYADFITAYMNKQGMELSTKGSSEYKTGMIVQYSPNVKVEKENAPGETLSENDKIKFASGDELTAADAKTLANGGTVGGKYSYLNAPIDNAKYNDKNRLNKSLVFTNTENARRLVFCAYYYVYNVQKDEIEMTDPVYFYLYDAGNAIVEES